MTDKRIILTTVYLTSPIRFFHDNYNKTILNPSMTFFIIIIYVCVCMCTCVSFGYDLNYIINCQNANFVLIFSYLEAYYITLYALIAFTVIISFVTALAFIINRYASLRTITIF